MNAIITAYKNLDKGKEKIAMKRFIAMLLAVVMCIGLFAGCGSKTEEKPAAEAGNAAAAPAEKAEVGGGESSLKGKRVRVVIGSTSTGGDSYMIADMVTRYLSEEMGFNGKVDAVGNAAALDAITKADGDGTTIMMFHDMAYLSVLFGAVGEEYALENLTVGPQIGSNPGGCFGSNAATPYNSLVEAAEWLVANPDETVSINIEAGSASHLCFGVFYMWAKETYGEDVASRIKAIVGGTTDEKKQRLWDGNADIIYADVSSLVEYTKEGVDAQLATKIFDTCGVVEGYSSMADAGMTFNGEVFSFNKDFFMYFPKDMDEGILAEINEAMMKVAANPEFQAEMANLKYTAVSPENTDMAVSREYINSKRDAAVAIVEQCPSLDELT